MLSRLFEVTADSSASQSEDEQLSVPEQSTLTLAQRLEAAISHIEDTKCEGDREMKGKHLSKELEIFEATGEKNTNIKLLFNALKTVPPTSIESERAFSAAGLFITKMRTRLSDCSIDHLCFLKSYYKNV
jgi:hypothetical protein